MWHLLQRTTHLPCLLFVFMANWPSSKFQSKKYPQKVKHLLPAFTVIVDSWRKHGYLEISGSSKSLVTDVASMSSLACVKPKVRHEMSGLDKHLATVSTWERSFSGVVAHVGPKAACLHVWLAALSTRIPLSFTVSCSIQLNSLLPPCPQWTVNRRSNLLFPPQWTISWHITLLGCSYRGITGHIRFLSCPCHWCFPFHSGQWRSIFTAVGSQ